jgi:hypothetical protein
MAVTTLLLNIRAGDAVPADQHLKCSHNLPVGSLPPMQVREGLQNARKELVSVFPEEEEEEEEEEEGVIISFLP